MRRFSCTCARLHFSLVIDQLVRKLGSTIHFLFVGLLGPIWKEHVVWFFFVRKMHLPCSTNLQWRIIWFILGMPRKTARDTQKNSFSYSVSFRRNGNVRPCRIGRPNFMVSIAIGKTFLSMECINALSRGLLKRSCNLAWMICGSFVAESSIIVSSVRRCLTRRDFTRKKVRQLNIYDQLVMFMIKSTSMSFVKVTDPF